jgi:hypothetical protein
VAQLAVRGLSDEWAAQVAETPHQEGMKFAARPPRSPDPHGLEDGARSAIRHLLQLPIEPEIQLHFARTSPVRRDEILECHRLDRDRHSGGAAACAARRNVDTILDGKLGAVSSLGDPPLAEVTDLPATVRIGVPADVAGKFARRR